MSPSVTNTSILVQDFARNDFELRQFVVGGEGAPSHPRRAYETRKHGPPHTAHARRGGVRAPAVRAHTAAHAQLHRRTPRTAARRAQPHATHGRTPRTAACHARPHAAHSHMQSRVGRHTPWRGRSLPSPIRLPPSPPHRARVSPHLRCVCPHARDDARAVVHRAYTNFAWTDRDGYFREFVMKDRAAAVRDWMAGDDAAMAQAVRTASKLTRTWLAWCKTQSVEALPAMRMDFLIRRTVRILSCFLHSVERWTGRGCGCVPACAHLPHYSSLMCPFHALTSPPFGPDVLHPPCAHRRAVRAHPHPLTGPGGRRSLHPRADRARILHARSRDAAAAGLWGVAHLVL